MKKNILVMTKHYPAKDHDFNETKVVYYFAQEWMKKGYNVKVIHNYILFPRIAYIFFRFFYSC